MAPEAMTEPPSGRQYALASGDDRAVVVEVGGGVRSYVADGRDLLDGYAEEEMVSSGRGQPLVPWPNRLRDGRYRWDGVEHRTPLTEPDKGNAIHGLLRFVNWTGREHTPSRVVLGYVLHPQPGYPFTLDVQIAYQLGPDGLVVTTTARNIGRQPLPYASGQHPYLTAGGGLVDACTLEAPAATALTTDDRSIPTGRRPVDGTDEDFRSPRQIGTVRLDGAFTDLRRDADGLARVRLRCPDGDGAELWMDGAYRYLQLFTGDALADESRRRRSLAVEPMTAPPNAFGSGTDVTRIEPGEHTSATWGLRPLGRSDG